MAGPLPTQRRSNFGTAVAACAALLLIVAVSMRQAPSFVGSRKCPAGTQRQLGVGLRAVDKALKERIVSVKKTGKLTDAMRVVAAAQVRRAQEGCEKSRPFTNELTAMIKGITKKLKGTGIEAELPMLKVPEKVNAVGILYLASNRGLCGSYNSFTGRRIAARIEQLNDQGVTNVIVVPVGTKGPRQMDRRCVGLNYTVSDTRYDFPDKISSKFTNEVGETLRNLFMSGEVDKVEILYAKFFNLLKNVPTVRTLLPLSATAIDDPEDETFSLTTDNGKLSVEKEKVEKVKAKEIENDVIFDQEPGVILNAMLPLYLNSQLLTLMFEAKASELGSRMGAMKAATDNANDLADRLNTVYNKKRQAGITAEICEISAGAMAVESADATGAQELGFDDNEESITDEFMAEIESGSTPDRPIAPEDIYKEGTELYKEMMGDRGR